MVTVKQKGDYSKITRYLEKVKTAVRIKTLEKYGQEGVAALSAATPVDTGLTANSWKYDIEESEGVIKLVFSNTNVVKGIPIAIILQYGHGTGTGGWVEGRDYINPAIQPIFDRIADDVWKEVKGL